LLPPSVPLAPPSSSCILFRGDFLVFTASVFCFFWPFPLLLAGCCLFLPQFFSSPSLSLTNFGILFIKSVKSESCGYNLLNAVHRQERTVYILAEISGRVTAEFRSSSGRASAGVPYIGQPPVLYFPRLCPTSAGARSELGRCPLKKPRPLVVSDARDTGRYSAVHRPTCFPMWLRWGCDEGAR
jgi:hypothetical protein